MESKEDKLDGAFLAGIKEELASIEENEKNIQALSQVFRYYTKYAKQLSQVLFDFAVKQCFPWEVIHAMHLLDDILLMDNTGRYKAELVDHVQGITKKAFLAAKTAQERKEVANMLQTWLELKLFDKSVVEAIKAAIRSSRGAKSLEMLDEVVDEAEVAQEPARPSPSPDPEAVPPTSGAKRKRQDDVPANNSDTAAILAERKKREAKAVANVEDGAAGAKRIANAKAQQAVVLAEVDRVLSSSSEQPFAILGLSKEGADGAAIRKAYRSLALIIHPDKLGPTAAAELGQRCQEALVKAQAARETAETDLSMRPDPKEERRGGETRSAATKVKNADLDGIFKCKYPGCELPPCKQCANGCCTLSITHCHFAARNKGGLQCFFHPPPRAWARNATQQGF